MPYKNKEDKVKRQKKRREAPVNEAPNVEAPDTPSNKVNQGGVRYNYSHDWFKS